MAPQKTFPPFLALANDSTSLGILPTVDDSPSDRGKGDRNRLPKLPLPFNPLQGAIPQSLLRGVFILTEGRQFGLVY